MYFVLTFFFHAENGKADIGSVKKFVSNVAVFLTGKLQFLLWSKIENIIEFNMVKLFIDLGVSSTHK